MNQPAGGSVTGGSVVGGSVTGGSVVGGSVTGGLVVVGAGAVVGGESVVGGAVLGGVPSAVGGWVSGASLDCGLDAEPPEDGATTSIERVVVVAPLVDDLVPFDDWVVVVVDWHAPRLDRLRCFGQMAAPADGEDDVWPPDDATPEVVAIVPGPESVLGEPVVVVTGCFL